MRSADTMVMTGRGLIRSTSLRAWKGWFNECWRGWMQSGLVCSLGKFGNVRTRQLRVDQQPVVHTSAPPPCARGYSDRSSKGSQQTVRSRSTQTLETPPGIQCLSPTLPSFIDRRKLSTCMSHKSVHMRESALQTVLGHRPQNTGGRYAPSIRRFRAQEYGGSPPGNLLLGFESPKCDALSQGFKGRRGGTHGRSGSGVDTRPRRIH